MGIWCLVSEDVHVLVHDLATARLKHLQTLQGRETWGRRSQEEELAILTGQIRRWLSVEGVRNQARCLIDRVGSLGAGAAAAAKRRNWALLEEARMSKERNALPRAIGSTEGANFCCKVTNLIFFQAFL